MNKIYKVIWNKAKGCYQVASEFAHQQGRSGSTKSAVKHTAAVLAVMALLGGISGINMVSAADQDKDTVTAGNATIKGDENNNFVVSGNGGQAVGDVSSAGQSIIISALDDTSTKPNHTQTTVKNTNETIAIGNGIQATVNDDIKSDKYYYLYHANTVIGTHAKSIDSGEGVALGSESSLKNVKMGVAIGYGASVSNSTYQKNEYGKIAGMALGYHANVTNAQGGIAIGAQTTATADGSVALGSGSLAAEADTVSVGNVGRYYRRIVNVEGGRFTEGSHDAVTAGQLYAAGMVPGTIEAKQGDTATNSIAMGEKSKVTGNNSIAIGGQALSSADVVMGQDATATSVNATAIGNNSHATASQATALGQNACATAEGAVALGNNSVANEKNTVSVGNKGSERKIVNVADGTVAENSTDAVTGGQLYGVKEDVDELNNSAVKYDNADKTSVTFGGTNGTALKNVSDIYSSTGKGHIYFYGDNVHIGADNSNNGVNVTTDGAAVQGNLNVTGNFSVGDDPESGTGFAFDQTNGLSSAFYGSTTKDGITERNQSFLKQNDDGITLSYKHQTDSDATGNITDADNTFTFGKDGVKLSGQNGAALKITGVADGTDAQDTVTIGQLANNNDKATAGLVKWDKDEKGKVTNAIKGVSFDGDGAFSTTVSRSMLGGTNTLSFNDAGLTISGTKDDGSAFGTTSILGGTITTNKVTGLAKGDISETSTDAVNGSQLFDVKNSVDGLNNLAVKYDNADKTSVTFGGTNGTALKNVSDIYSSTGKGHIYFYGDNVHIGADNSNNGVNVTTDGAAVQGNLNVTGNFSVGDDPESGTGFAFDQTNGLSSAFYGSTTKDGITERNQSFLKQNDDGITLSYKHQTDSDATGNITDADNTFTFGKDGVKLSGQNGAALKITGVADGTEATDAVNFGQLTSKITDATKNSVQYDNADKSSVTFKGENGTTLKNVSAIEGVGGSKLTMNQYGAGLYFGDYQITATNHGAGIRVINSDGNSTSSIMVSKDKGVTVSGGLDVTGSVISNVADGKNTSDAVNKGQLDAVSDKVSSLDKDSVKWDKDDKGNTTNKINGVGLKDGTVTADKISVGDKFKVDKDGNVTTGNLEVNGTFKVNGSEIATKGDITDISGAIKDVNSRVDVTNKIVGDGKLDNGADNLTAGINKNSASITTINCQIGATGEKGALKLTNGATTIESGINQNTAAIQQNSEAINSLGRGLNHLGQEVDNVGAISAALAGLHPLGYDGDGSKFQIAAAVGTYDGTQAAALGGFYHFNRDVMMSLGASSSFGSDNKTAANLGVTFRVGQGSGDRKIADSSTMDTILQRLEKLDKEVAGLKEENKKLTQENEQQKQELEALKR